MTPVGDLGDSYESAFYAVSEAYTSTAEQVGKQNVKTEAALKQIDKLEEIYRGGSK